MPKVFVTHAHFKLKQSMNMAHDFGEVVFMTTDEYQSEPSIKGHNESIKNAIKQKMKDYIPGVDYIITSGSPISILLTGMALSGHLSNNVRSTHNILKWNASQHKYELCKI